MYTSFSIIVIFYNQEGQEEANHCPNEIYNINIHERN